MPTRNVSEPDLFDRLRGDAEESQAAWRELRDRLRAEPARYARPLASALLASLETGAVMPVRGAILPALEASTRDQPDVLPSEVLDRLLQRAAELDTLSVLCLALLRVRAVYLAGRLLVSDTWLAAPAIDSHTPRPIVPVELTETSRA